MRTLVIVVIVMSAMITEQAIVSKTLTINTLFPYLGSIKPIIAANYKFPGPLIEAYENDTIIVRVINNLAQPTTIHWHGMFQIGTPNMDGVVGVTQCAIPSFSEMTYTFMAQPAGTAFYHGHYLDQYADGLIGPLIIRRQVEPNGQLYDTERILMVSDWYNDAAQTKLSSWYLSAKNPDGIEPIPDAIVVNGKFSQSLFVTTSNATSIRFRIINAAAFSMFTVSIDGLPLHIIELDQTAVVPYTVSSFSISVAQRVSFYVNLNEFNDTFVPPDMLPIKSVYIRFKANEEMYPADIKHYIAPYATRYVPYSIFLNPLYLAILSFGSQHSLPTYSADQTSSSLSSGALPKQDDTNMLSARPFSQVNNVVPNATHSLKLVISFCSDSLNITRGYFNNVTYSSNTININNNSSLTQSTVLNTTTPILYQMAMNPRTLNIPSPVRENNGSLPIIQSDGNGHYLVPYQAVVDIFLDNHDDGEHPFHLHGHDFWIIATSDYPQAEQLYRTAYIQRDVVSVPASGWAKIRFLANNPGAWLLHCHIEWHMDAGLILAFIVGPDQIAAQGYNVTANQQRFC
ncbi:unnamed protein product [Rotaria magnacalcarata]|uniref:Laccase n=2 Tax=Rotaria magnacalcarata TaxID=392030 RepID=A0A819AK38_9BILA|nr:unnamed protein product [Rotaria magnacalcarata]CAF3778838.1 unnamed protein product [Rotaria magnacalcarata]CAF3798303.1 unnamed protein product [Rotaria magnacalcarata]